MNKILNVKRLNSQMVLMEISAGLIAKKALAGQFVVIKIDERGERIPLTICKRDKVTGTITIIFQEVGKTTRKLATLKEGGYLADVLGPLGTPTHIEPRGKVALVGGGVGIAEILPVARAMKEAGNKVFAVIGSRSKELLILESDMSLAADELYVTTDDGSYKRKGFVTDVLKEIMDKEKPSLVYAVGPIPMMKAVSNLTKSYSVKTMVSLNANMVDATGMCGTCRVSVAGKTKFTCVDGPEFDGHQVDWDEFIKRDKRFAREEKISLENFLENKKSITTAIIDRSANIY